MVPSRPHSKGIGCPQAKTAFVIELVACLKSEIGAGGQILGGSAELEIGPEFQALTEWAAMFEAERRSP